MNMKPILNKDITVDDFLNNFWCLTELIKFCSENGLPVAGHKESVTQRIALYLRTGHIKKSGYSRKRLACGEYIDIDTKVERDFRFTDDHKAFFRKRIGYTFSMNNVFYQWLKDNQGKTYKEALEQYYLILEKKWNKKMVEGSSYAMHNYVRDFLADNPKTNLDHAMQCWEYKKSLAGLNKSYERSDLIGIYVEEG